MTHGYDRFFSHVRVRGVGCLASNSERLRPFLRQTARQAFTIALGRLLCRIERLLRLIYTFGHALLNLLIGTRGFQIVEDQNRKAYISDESKSFDRFEVGLKDFYPHVIVIFERNDALRAHCSHFDQHGGDGDNKEC